ncbi:MAG: YesL family protein [Dorea sp.]
MNFFVIDSPVMRFLGRVGDILLLNIIFVVTSIPVITIGTALSALYTVAMKLVRGEDPAIIKEYLKAYKRNFKPATICWLIMAVIGVLLFVDFRLVAVFSGTAYTVMRLLLAMILGIWLLTFLYLFPYIARFDNTVLNSMKNALFLSVAHIPSTLMMLGVAIGLLIITLFTSKTFVIGTILWTFFGFAILAYVQSFLLCRIFTKYE